MGGEIAGRPLTGTASAPRARPRASGRRASRVRRAPGWSWGEATGGASRRTAAYRTDGDRSNHRAPQASGRVRRRRSRLLPVRERRNVGPFVFADIIGPDEMPSGVGADIATHPHIGLATVTYLFDGAMVHRDSTGAVQRIEPGAVNWMTAGRGRRPLRAQPRRRPGGHLADVAGLQTWVALPEEAGGDRRRFRARRCRRGPRVRRRQRARSCSSPGQRSVCDRRSPASSPLFHIDVAARRGRGARHSVRAR